VCVCVCVFSVSEGKGRAGKARWVPWIYSLAHNDHLLDDINLVIWLMRVVGEINMQFI
jgi:hypothetical protein